MIARVGVRGKRKDKGMPPRRGGRPRRAEPQICKGSSRYGGVSYLLSHCLVIAEFGACGGTRTGHLHGVEAGRMTQTEPMCGKKVGKLRLQAYVNAPFDRKK
jgi:hypothetical protein